MAADIAYKDMSASYYSLTLGSDRIEDQEQSFSVSISVKKTAGHCLINYDDQYYMDWYE